MLRSYSPVWLLLALAAVGCNDSNDVAEPNQFQTRLYANNLKAPIGLSATDQDQLWVTEAGTGSNDARVSMIDKNGQVYPVIVGFSSAFANGSIEGIGHLRYKDGKVYVLDGAAGKLYIVDVSRFKVGDTPLQASTLSGEDIASYVRRQNLTNPVNSNLYNLAFGPGDDLYLVDSGSNAIIRRDKATKALSVFARFPNVTATAEAVPTGIVYDGTNFLVSAFGGGPFITGSAKLFRVSRTGVVSEYKAGFTTLTDVVLTAGNKPLVTEYGQFSLTPPTIGFVPRSGRIANEDGKTLLSLQDRPTDIERVGSQTYYVLSYGDGTVQKMTAD